MSCLFASHGQSIGASISASVFPSEYSGLISFTIDCFDLLAVQETQESSPAPQFESISSLAFSLLYGPTSIHDYWKNHSFDYMDLCWQSDVSAFKCIVWICQSFHSKEQVSFNFMAAITVHSDFGRQGNKICHCFHFSSSICHEVMGPDTMILVFWMLSFKIAFSFSSFTPIKRFFSSSPLHFLPLEWYHLHIWGYWYFSWQS